MFKKIEKVVEEETVVETPMVVEETVKVGKPKWSLKKKLIVAGAAVAGLILGAVALSIKKSPNASDDQDGIDDTEDEELAELERLEAAEATEESQG